MEWISVFLWMLIGGLIGAAIGRYRNRPGAGTIFGILLGPIGWLIVWLGPDERRHCPECHGVVPEAARKCMHCASEIGAAGAPHITYRATTCPRCGERGKVSEAAAQGPIECPTCNNCYQPEKFFYAK